MSHLLLGVGVLQLASSAMLGWLIALGRAQPEALGKIGIKAPRRIMQLHLDQVMMGLIDLAVGTAFPDVPHVIGWLIVVGTIFNPLGFLPLAFSPKLEQKLVFRVPTVLSFICTSGGLVSLAVWELTSR